MIDTIGIRKRVGTGAPLPFSLVFQLCDEIDRLRKQAAARECEDQRELAMDSVRQGTKQTPQGKTLIVALQILEPIANDVKSSIILSAHNTNTVEEAIGVALLRHVGGNRSLGALSTASIDDLTADLPVPDEVTVKAEVGDERSNTTSS